MNEKTISVINSISTSLENISKIIENTFLEKLLEPTLWIAIAVAIIAVMQWKTAEKQRAQDLFDKRYALYERIFSIFYQKQVQNKDVSEKDLLPYANEALFLFDEDVAKHILSIKDFNSKKLDYDFINKPFLKYMKVK